jgi:hypothetical protein
MHVYGYVPYVDFTCCLCWIIENRTWIYTEDIIINIYADNNAKEILHTYLIHDDLMDAFEVDLAGRIYGKKNSNGEATY